MHATIVVQARADVCETQDLLALAAQHPVLAGVVGWADLPAGHVDRQLEALRTGYGGQRL